MSHIKRNVLHVTKGFEMIDFWDNAYDVLSCKMDNNGDIICFTEHDDNIPLTEFHFIVIQTNAIIPEIPQNILEDYCFVDTIISPTGNEFHLFLFVPEED